MRKLFILFGFMLFVAGSVRAQNFEVAGNYQYVHTPGYNGGPSTNCQGAGGSAAANLNNWVGVVGDFGGCKVTGLVSGTSASEINYLFGPRITYHGYGRFSPYFQTLLGGVHDSASATGFPSTSANSFGWTIGGGADFALTKHVSFRAIQFEYFMTHFNSERQNNIRIVSGLVYHFGSSKR